MPIVIAMPHTPVKATFSSDTSSAGMCQASPLAASPAATSAAVLFPCPNLRRARDGTEAVVGRMGISPAIHWRASATPACISLGRTPSPDEAPKRWAPRMRGRTPPPPPPPPPPSPPEAAPTPPPAAAVAVPAVATPAAATPAAVLATVAATAAVTDAVRSRDTAELVCTRQACASSSCCARGGGSLRLAFGCGGGCGDDGGGKGGG
jgi:hypothetical protein